MIQLLKGVPASILAWCGTILAITFLGCLTFLSYAGKDVSSLTQLINTILNFAGVGLAGTAAVAAGSAAAKSHQAAQQTNGALDARIRDVVLAALTEHEGDAFRTDGGTSPPSPATSAYRRPAP